MKLFLLILLFILSFIPSKGQTSFSSKVWNRFYELVQLPIDQQVDGFKKLQHECIKHNLINDSTYTNLLFLYATAQFDSNKIDTAISLLKESIQISKNNPSKNPIPYLSKYHFYLAYYQSQLNKFEAAVSNYHIAYDLGVKQHNKWGIPSLACQQLSHLYYEIGDYKLGLKYATLGVQLDEKNQDVNQFINNLYEQCLNLHALDLYAQLQPRLDSLLSFSELYADPFKKGLFYTLLAKVETNNKDYVKAEKAFLQANQFFEQSKEQEYSVMNYVALQYLSILRQDYSKSLYYEKLANSKTEIPFIKSVVFANKSLHFKQTHDYPNALKYIDQSLKALPIDFSNRSKNNNPSAEQLRKLPQKEYVFNALFEKAEILSLDRNTWHQSLETYTLLDSLVDLMRWQHQDIGSKLFWREKLISLYEKAIETCFNLNKPEMAFFFMEKSRSALLVDQLNHNMASFSLPFNEANKETALRLDVIRNQYANNKQELADYLQARSKFDDYVNYLEQKYPQYYELKYGNKVPSISEVKQYLSKNKQCIYSYFEGNNYLYALLINEKALSLKKIPSKSYQKNKFEFSSLLANPNWSKSDLNQFLSYANNLYELVWKPFEKEATSRVIISTSGDIIPFAAFSTSKNKPDYLLNNYAFSYIYSARVLLAQSNQKSKRSSKKSDFLGIAPVNFPYNRSLMSLNGSAQAIAINGNLFQSSQIFLENKANLANFENYWPRSKVVQIISHAYADSELGKPTIYFADQGLSLENIKPQEVQTQLLMLSACRTGIGKEYKGEGVYSLSRGFFGTGVPSIYSTLWDIIDVDAYSISNMILALVKKKAPLDIALQNAQKDWLKNADQNKQLPHAWAGIILLGDSASLSEESNFKMWIYIAFALGLITIIGTYIVMKSRKKRKFNQ